MRVVSFYTDNYSEEAERLICSLKKFCIKHDVERIESLGSWDKNTNHKAVFIKRKLLKYMSPVVWIDADAEITRYPKYFDVIEEDIGVYYENLSKLKSGTIFFNHTVPALKVLERWEENSRNHEITDQTHLQHVLRGEYIESHKVTLFCLPCSYCYIVDIMEGWCKPVITHYQSSRKFRRTVRR